MVIQNSFTESWQGGNMAAVETAFVPEALFYMEEVSSGVTLKAKSTERYLKAEPGGAT